MFMEITSEYPELNMIPIKIIPKPMCASDPPASLNVDFFRSLIKIVALATMVNIPASTMIMYFQSYTFANTMTAVDKRMDTT